MPNKHFFLLFSVSMGLLIFSQPSRKSEDWADLARHFYSEAGQKQKNLMARLAAYPDLEEDLRKELFFGGRKFLAMDVISTLQLHSLLPDLLKISEDDETGFSYNTINSLMTEENRTALTRVYLTRLFAKRTTPASKVVILDTLGRLQFRVSRPSLQRVLLQDPSPEVRSAALHYLRSLLMNGHREFLPLLGLTLGAEPMQLRIQAHYLLSEMKIRMRNLQLSQKGIR